MMLRNHRHMGGEHLSDGDQFEGGAIDGLQSEHHYKIRGWETKLGHYFCRPVWPLIEILPQEWQLLFECPHAGPLQRCEGLLAILHGYGLWVPPHFPIEVFQEV